MYIQHPGVLNDLGVVCVRFLVSSVNLGPEGRRPLGRPRRRWEDNIKMDLREIGFGDLD
jgi:hypothetical protein